MPNKSRNNRAISRVIEKAEDEVADFPPVVEEEGADEVVEVETQPETVVEETITEVKEPVVEEEKQSTSKLAEVMKQLQAALVSIPVPAAAEAREKYLYRVQISGQLHGEPLEWDDAHRAGQAIVAAGVKLAAVMVVGVSGPGPFSKPLGWAPAKSREARIPSLKIEGEKLLKEYVAAAEAAKVAEEEAEDKAA